MGDFKVETIPDEKPNVTDILSLLLSNEVAAYTKTVQGIRCELCPYRTFTRFSLLKDHLKHHCAANMYMASPRSPQLAVVRAYFNYCQSVFPITTHGSETLNLFHYSTSIIRDWNASCSMKTLSVLQKVNRLPLVRVLTHHGPQY